MNAQEALFYLKRGLEELHIVKKEKDKSVPELDLVIDVHIACISALDKQIPRKPLISDNDNWLCPNCRQYVSVICFNGVPFWAPKNFCPFCGQALGDFKHGR